MGCDTSGHYFWFGLALSIASYRLFFHRTCKYPGRKLEGLTKWAAARIAHRTQRYYAYLQSLHDGFGDVVRTGPQEISINNVDAIKAIYGRDSLCLRGPWYDLGGTGLNLHRTRDPNLHERQRPLWEKGFREMSGHADKVEAKTRDFMGWLAKNPGRLNIAPEYQLFTFKLMAYVIFSIDMDVNAELRQRAEQTYKTLTRSQTALGTLGHVPWMYSVNERFPGLIRQNEEFTCLANELLQRRRSFKPEVPDLFTYLLPTENDPTTAQFPLDWEARLAMVAGSGNVSSALTSTTFYLSKKANKARVARLRKELDPMLSTVSFDPHVAYPILDSVIFESIRLQPLVPNRGGERKTPPEGIQCLDGWVPGNTILRVPSYTLFRDQRYFERAEEWIPERWTSQQDLVKNRTAFMPFSTGPYSCVGRPLGLVEIRLILARLVYQFDFDLDQDADEFERSGKDHFGLVFDRLALDVTLRSVI